MTNTHNSAKPTAPVQSPPPVVAPPPKLLTSTHETYRAPYNAHAHVVQHGLNTSFPEAPMTPPHHNALQRFSNALNQHPSGSLNHRMGNHRLGNRPLTAPTHPLSHFNHNHNHSHHNMHHNMQSAYNRNRQQRLAKIELKNRRIGARAERLDNHKSLANAHRQKAALMSWWNPFTWIPKIYHHTSSTIHSGKAMVHGKRLRNHELRKEELVANLRLKNRKFRLQQRRQEHRASGVLR